MGVVTCNTAKNAIISALGKLVISFYSKRYLTHTNVVLFFVVESLLMRTIGRDVPVELYRNREEKKGGLKQFIQDWCSRVTRVLFLPGTSSS